jgi:hypothetical protein
LGSSGLRYVYAGDLIESTEDNCVGVRIADEQYGLENERIIWVANLINVAIGDTHFERLEGPTFKQFFQCGGFHRRLTAGR